MNRKWLCKEFEMWDDVLEFLNGLPEEVAIEAKLVTFQSVMGNGQGYGVVYREVM